jgi:hypothetical protein
VIEPPHHRSPPQRIASEQQNHPSAGTPTGFATKSANKRQAIIEAFAQRALLYGGENRLDRAADLSGRIARANIRQALAVFDEYTRTTVLSIIEQVGGLA